MTLPTDQEIASVAAALGISYSGNDLISVAELVRSSVFDARRIDELPGDPVDADDSRSDWHYPDSADNPMNAWYVRTNIDGTSAGRLSGRTVAIKDNVFVAGIPMMNGTRILEGYVPPVDATIVNRLLGAGATIAGKSVCEAYCFSSGSHTSDSGPVLNPHNRAHSAGGSSSGSAALVADSEVDLAIGCDQGGSIRMPSSFCGVYGMKPTHGLVPYTGILGMHPNIDHAGPITASVADNALMLEVIAGPDGLDSRQYGHEPESYTGALGADVAGMKIGVLAEGFGHPNSEADVDTSVAAAAGRFGDLGAEISNVSVPMHLDTWLIFAALMPAVFDVMFMNDGLSPGWNDVVVASYLEAQHGWHARADDLPEGIKVSLIAAQVSRRERGYTGVGRAINQIKRLRAAYDSVFDEVDLLLLPTTVQKATVLPAHDARREEIIALSNASLANTSPFNLTNHPAMSLPCAMSGGLPVGLMLVGSHFDEVSIYRAAHAYEQHVDWKTV